MTEQEKIEHEVVATIIVSESELNDDFTNTINANMFTVSALAETYKCIISIRDSGKPVELVSIVAELKRINRLEYVGGIMFVSGLTSHYIASDIFRERILLLHESFFRKRMVQIGSEIQSMAMTDSIDVFDAIGKSVMLVDELNSITDIRKERDKKDILEETIRSIEARKHSGINGVPSGIPEVDSSVGGFEKGGVTIIAGRPGSGKTAFAISMVNKMISDKSLSGLFFSLEMSAESLYQRFLAINGDVRSGNIWRGSLDGKEWSRIGSSFDRINAAGIEVYDKYFTVSEIVAKCRSMHLKKPLDFVVIDYLQLITSDSKQRGNREQEVSSISRALKIMSMQMNIPVIALSQLSRAVEQRGGDKRPQLSDLRESGSIEQDASMVLFTYRPSYYGFLGESGESLEDRAYLIMGKHRNGALKDIELFYKHDHNQEWASFHNQTVREPESFIVDEFPKNSFKPNDEF
jgi:replicative DNA helicase